MARPGKSAAASTKGDVNMTDAGKVKRTINKSKRRKEQAAAVKASAAAAAAGAKRESKKERRKRIALSALAGAKIPGSAKAETPDQLRQRHAQEWKDMKAKVTALKKLRQNMPKKGSKEKKATVAQEIKQLQEDMQVRHLAELRAAGLDPPAVPMKKWGKAAAADAMSDA
eukprot:gb/GFBE01079987.1/.p1 GENE.gb/GFBE01079987.1/~~gb/GFBE01079987.1/.p1  ORF type:complete len:170 (+),score=51.12 gb/GFBE01079987.1/:1-510(+)